MTTKQFLGQYKMLDKEIDSLLEDTEALRSRAERAGASVIDGSSKTAKSDNSATFEYLADKIAEIEDDVNFKIDRLIEIRKSIECAITELEDTTLRTLLRWHYLRDYSLEAIAVKLEYSYMHVCRLHGKALQQINYKGD